MPRTNLVTNFCVDPPWPKKKGGLRKARPNQGRCLEYTTMPVSEIFKLLDNQIFTQAATPHNVFLWSIDQFLHVGEAEMLSRGYRMHARLVWDKGNGVAPCFTVRFSHEYLTWFYKPTLPRVADSARGKFTTVIRAKARQHSRKPDEAYKMIASMYPGRNRMDVFSREYRPGWLQYGNEINKFSQEK